LLTASDSSGSKRNVNRTFLLGSLLIVLLAGFLRIHHIAQRSLWLDEAIAANISRGTLSETLVLTRGLHSAPIVHPFILYAVERVGSGPLAVRLPSLVASVLGVCLMLCFVTIPTVDPKAAALAALMLGVSATEIRYGQEVREYSLSVLFAALLMYSFLSYISNKKESNTPTLLYLTLFAAPFVQYGLVLFSFAILAALFILWIADRGRRIRFLHIVFASLASAVGGLISNALTLRYQWEPKVYLQENYFTAGSSLMAFVWSNTRYLLAFLLPGRGAAMISAAAIALYLVTSLRTRTVSPLVILALTSFGTVLACSILRVYPYGGVRQCLFLAPVLCLVASESVVQDAKMLPGNMGVPAFALVVCGVLASGALQIRSFAPYAEIEDIQPVLAGLKSRLELGDRVYVYSGAVPAVDFYVRDRDARFIYGDFHREAPQEYASEMLAALPEGTIRVWIIFSHVVEDEDQRILHDLSSAWEVRPVLFAKGSALYVASLGDAPAPGIYANRSRELEGNSATHAAVRSGDSFWDWNLRNSRSTVR
jgi:hypothetical protein